jgi:hypothetical protein
VSMSSELNYHELRTDKSALGHKRLTGQQ